METDPNSAICEKCGHINTVDVCHGCMKPLHSKAFKDLLSEYDLLKATVKTLTDDLNHWKRRASFAEEQVIRYSRPK